MSNFEDQIERAEEKDARDFYEVQCARVREGEDRVLGCKRAVERQQETLKDAESMLASARSDKAEAYKRLSDVIAKVERSRLAASAPGADVIGEAVEKMVADTNSLTPGEPVSDEDLANIVDGEASVSNGFDRNALQKIKPDDEPNVGIIDGRNLTEAAIQTDALRASNTVASWGLEATTEEGETASITVEQEVPCPPPVPLIDATDDVTAEEAMASESDDHPIF